MNMAMKVRGLPPNHPYHIGTQTDVGHKNPIHDIHMKRIPSRPLSQPTALRQPPVISRKQ
jgi:hypothetical protein